MRGVDLHSGAKAIVTKGHKTGKYFISLTDSVAMKYVDYIGIEKPTLIEIAKPAVEPTIF